MLLLLNGKLLDKQNVPKNISFTLLIRIALLKISSEHTQKIVGLIFNIFYIGSYVKLCPVIAAIFFLSISTKVVSSNPTHGEMYLIPLYVIEFVSDLRQVGGFLWVLRFPPSIRLTATI